MSCRNTILPLAALLAGPLLLPLSASAEGPAPAVAVRPSLPVPEVWSVPPEAVRSAAVMLHSACAAWPRQVPVAPESNSPPLARDKPAEATLCEAALDPAGHRMFLMLLGGLFAMLGVGAAVGAYATVATLFRLLGVALERAALALWDRRPRRQRGWYE